MKDAYKIKNKFVTVIVVDEVMFQGKYFYELSDGTTIDQNTFDKLYRKVEDNIIGETSIKASEYDEAVKRVKEVRS